jgi:hypothetical protein
MITVLTPSPINGIVITNTGTLPQARCPMYFSGRIPFNVKKLLTNEHHKVAMYPPARNKNLGGSK